MTARRTVGSKASKRARNKAALERWAKQRLHAAQDGVAAAIREHFNAGRPIVVERAGKLYVQAGPRAKPRPLTSSNAIQAWQRSNPGFAQPGAPKYMTAPRKKTARKKPR